MDSKLRKRIGSGNLIVELGCGSREILRALEKDFDQRIGLDISRKRLDMEGIQPEDWIFMEADLNAALPLIDDSADVVLANEVIEHVIDPFYFAEEVLRVLKPGGKCVLTTPNIRYLKNLWRILIGGRGPRTAGENILDGCWDDGHLHYFTHMDLRDLFLRAGFSEANSGALINLEIHNPLRTLVMTPKSWTLRSCGVEHHRN